MNILVLGASGMLGNAMVRSFSARPEFNTFGTVRFHEGSSSIQQIDDARLIFGVDVTNEIDLVRAFEKAQPDVVINCVGLVKQLIKLDDPLIALPINSLLPHRLARYCTLTGARLIHISTDCVFDGAVGQYIESDNPTARDLYGLSKLLGEVTQDGALTLRTSIIGHEIGSSHGLVEWFLSQTNSVRGFGKAVFSGLPTVELASLIRDVVIPRTELQGLYHVASMPIDKYSLLQLIAARYQKTVAITVDDSLVIDRSLNADRFNRITGYAPPPWPELVSRMYTFQQSSLV